MSIIRNIGNLHDSSTGALTGYINPVTGKEEALDAASLQALVSGAWSAAGGGALRLFPNAANSASANFSFLLEAQALAPFAAFRPIYVNFAASQTITQAKYALPPTTLHNGVALTWTNATFSGSNSGTQAAGSGSGQNVVPSILVGDWIFAPSVARTDDAAKNPLVQFRTHYTGASSQQSIFSNAMGDLATAEGLEYATNVSAGDLVTSPGSWAPARNNTWMCPVGVDFLYGIPTRVIADVGDSLMRGQESSTTSNGWRTVSQRAATLKRASTAIWQAASFAVTGQNTAASYLTALEVVTQLRPTYLCVRAWSPNDGTPTQALMDAAWARALAIVEHCRRNNVVPVLCTSGPVNAYTAPQDALLKAQNARVMGMAGFAVVSDEGAAVEDPADRSNILPAYDSGDGVHYVSAAYDAMAAVRAAALAR
jgi:hypothetical protein